MFKHALADPRYFLEITGFYWDNVIDKSIGVQIHHVHDRATTSSKDQAEIAAGIAKLVLLSPPKFTGFSDLTKYFADNVLSSIPKRYVYDDVFWCCFLSILDKSGSPECSLGGPLHKMVLKLHDDFDPNDVEL